MSFYFPYEGIYLIETLINLTGYTVASRQRTINGDIGIGYKTKNAYDKSKRNECLVPIDVHNRLDTRTYWISFAILLLTILSIVMQITFCNKKNSTEKTYIIKEIYKHTNNNSSDV